MIFQTARSDAGHHRDNAEGWISSRAFRARCADNSPATSNGKPDSNRNPQSGSNPIIYTIGNHDWYYHLPVSVLTSSGGYRGKPRSQQPGQRLPYEMDEYDRSKNWERATKY